jgi:hypothetical protein
LICVSIYQNWHKGVCFYSLSSFGDAFYTKSTRRPRQAPGQFPNRLEVIQKNVSDWLIECDVTSLYKNLVKKQNPNFRGQAIQELIFPAAMIKQILKAVLMGVVSSIDFFWSNMANPAIYII